MAPLVVHELWQSCPVVIGRWQHSGRLTAVPLHPIARSLPDDEGIVHNSTQERCRDSSGIGCFEWVVVAMVIYPLPPVWERRWVVVVMGGGSDATNDDGDSSRHGWGQWFALQTWSI